jgi:hypothetical protein
VSAIFQRPLCDMGKAYDYSFRPVLGDPDPGAGGGCDERPLRVEMYAASAQFPADALVWRAFGLCAEHESQLRRFDGVFQARGPPSRFRAIAAVTSMPEPRGSSRR